MNISAPHQQLMKTRLHGALIASCQPVENGPMDKIEHIIAMAQAAVAGGAKALRIEGAENVAAVKKAVDVPIVGIIKRDLLASPVRITPLLRDVKALAKAGADIIAFDGTNRERPVSCEELLKEIHRQGCLSMADCGDYHSGIHLAELGCTFIGSTMSGYTSDEPAPVEPDYDLVAKWAKAGLCVIAEGRYNTPQKAAKAIAMGALCVTVGSAITRVEHIASWYSQCMQSATSKLKVVG